MTRSSDRVQRARLSTLALVNPAFQLKYAFIFVLLGVCAATVTLGAGWFALLQTLEELELSSQFDVGLLARRFLLLAPAVFVPFAAFMVVAAIIITHRIAGPAYAIARQLQILAQGLYPPPRTVRKGDELHEVMEVLKHSLELMRTREHDERLKIEVAVARLQAVAASGETDEVIRTLQSLVASKSVALGMKKGGADE